MIKITFVQPDGTAKSVDATEGLSLMEVAMRNNIQGIVAECGGQCSCATCHVHIDDTFFERVGPAVDDEEDMLDFAEERVATSRLGCQVSIEQELDGMTVRIPSQQG